MKGALLCQSTQWGEEGAGRQVARRDAGPLTTVLFVVKETRRTKDTLVTSTMLNGYGRRVARARVAVAVGDVPFNRCARMGFVVFYRQIGRYIWPLNY